MKMPRCSPQRHQNLGWLLIVLFAAAILHSPARADDATNIAFVDPSPASLSPDTHGEFNFNMIVKNTGNAGTATVVLLRDKQCPGGTVTPATMNSLGKNAVAIESFKLSDIYKLPATCYIELISDGKDGNSSLKQVKLNQLYTKSGVLWAFVVCVILAVVAAVIGFRFTQQTLTFHLGAPAWDFAKSWTSTTTLIGGLISTALALGALPELTQYASKSGYAILALVISLVAVVAPFVFTVIRTGKVERDARTGVYSVAYHGWVWAFLISSSMTLFAGLAQLVVFFLLLHEIFQGYSFWSYSQSLEPLSCNLGTILGTPVAIVLCGYAGYSVYLTIKLQLDANNMPAPAPSDQNSFVGPVLQTPIKPRLLPWTVM